MSMPPAVSDVSLLLSTLGGLADRPPQRWHDSIAQLVSCMNGAQFCYVHSTLPIVMLSQLQLELAPPNAIRQQAFIAAVCARASEQLVGPLNFSRLP